MDSTFVRLIGLFDSPWGLATITAILVLYSLFIFRIARSRFPTAHRVAVIGFPKSGKTTLIVSMFGEVFKRRLMNFKFVPRGDETVKRINSALESLELGRAIGPTTDQDVFAFRADIYSRSDIPFFSRTIKFEIGDFPGEDSDQFTNQFGDWLHETPYFKWAMEADAYVMVVDLAPFLDASLSREYVAKMEKSFRAAWQRLQEYHLDGAKDLASKPIVLAFTKADLFQVAMKPTSDKHTKDQISTMGFGTEFPRRRDINLAVFNTGVLSVASAFGDLIAYFRSESRKFNIVFLSSIVLHEDRLLGIGELLEQVLPRRIRLR